MTSFWKSNFEVGKILTHVPKSVLHEYAIPKIVSCVYLLKNLFNRFIKKSLNQVFRKHTRDTILEITYSWRTDFGACVSIFSDFEIRPSKWRHSVLKGNMTSFWIWNFKIEKNPIKICKIGSPRIFYCQDCISWEMRLNFPLRDFLPKKISRKKPP